MAKRLFPVTLGVLLVAYSAAALIFDAKTASNGAADSARLPFPSLRRAACRLKLATCRSAASLGGSSIRAARSSRKHCGGIPLLRIDGAIWGRRTCKPVFEDRTPGTVFARLSARDPIYRPSCFEQRTFTSWPASGKPRWNLGARCLTAFRDFDEVIFHQYLRMGGSLTDILRYGIPPEGPAARTFFRFLMRPGSGLRQHPDPDALLNEAWEWLQAHSLAEPGLLGEYVSSLLGRGRYRHAISVQTAFMETAHGPEGSGNNLFNGGFDREFSGSPLDWRIYQTDHGGAARERHPDGDAAWSLRLDFDGQANLNYSHVRQQAVVRPGRHRFRARVRPNHLTTDQGIGFRIFDPNNWRRLDIHTAHASGTSGWTRVEKHFTIPPGTELVEVWIVRRPSLKFDNKIGGTVWIDDVSLVPAARVRQGSG